MIIPPRFPPLNEETITWLRKHWWWFSPLFLVCLFGMAFLVQYFGPEAS